MIWMTDQVATSMLASPSSSEEGSSSTKTENVPTNTNAAHQRLLSLGPALALRRSVLRYRPLNVYESNWESQDHVPFDEPLAMNTIMSRLGVSLGGLLLPGCQWSTEMVHREDGNGASSASPPKRHQTNLATLSDGTEVVDVLMGLREPPPGFVELPFGAVAPPTPPTTTHTLTPVPIPTPSVPMMMPSTASSPLTLSSSPSPTEMIEERTIPQPHIPYSASLSSSPSPSIGMDLSKLLRPYSPPTPLYHADGRSIAPPITESSPSIWPSTATSTLDRHKRRRESGHNPTMTTTTGDNGHHYDITNNNGQQQQQLQLQQLQFHQQPPQQPIIGEPKASPSKPKGGRFRKPTSDDDLDGDDGDFEYGGGLSGRARRRKRNRRKRARGGDDSDGDLNTENNEDDDWAGAADDKPKSRRGSRRGDYTVIGHEEPSAPSSRRSGGGTSGETKERKQPALPSEASGRLDNWLFLNCMSLITASP
jgi:hypothetical protein